VVVIERHEGIKLEYARKVSSRKQGYAQIRFRVAQTMIAGSLGVPGKRAVEGGGWRICSHIPDSQLRAISLPRGGAGYGMKWYTVADLSYS
jgi:hypothetical protein